MRAGWVGVTTVSGSDAHGRCVPMSAFQQGTAAGAFELRDTARSVGSYLTGLFARHTRRLRGQHSVPCMSVL